MTDTVFVVLFRGINVGGNRIVPMEALRRALSDAGFGQVATYIQSGNVVLTSDEDAAATLARIETAFAAAFGFAAWTAIRSAKEWDTLVSGNPFSEHGAVDGRSVHAVILGGAPPEELIAALRRLATSEEIAISEGVLYLHTPDGLGRSKVAESLERTLGIQTTARNWNTVLKLQALAAEAGRPQR